MHYKLLICMHCFFLCSSLACRSVLRMRVASLGVHGCAGSEADADEGADVEAAKAQQVAALHRESTQHRD